MVSAQTHSEHVIYLQMELETKHDEARGQLSPNYSKYMGPINLVVGVVMVLGLAWVTMDAVARSEEREREALRRSDERMEEQRKRLKRRRGRRETEGKIQASEGEHNRSAL